MSNIEYYDIQYEADRTVSDVVLKSQQFPF